MLRISCHAKVNLFLRILARDADGFHSLETLFCLLSLADDLVVERRDGRDVTLDAGEADLGPEQENLAVRAAQAVLDATGRRFGVHLTLTKRIPARAGLGGGSSDAAGALTAVNALAGNAIPRHELLQMAARLGSDVPFFMSGGAFALGWGHGERLMRLPSPPLASALLLLALGVPRDTVMDDYLHTAERFHYRPREGRFPLQVMQVIAATEPGFLDAALGAIDEDFGGMAGFLRQGLGLDDAQCEHLRSGLLEGVSPDRESATAGDWQSSVPRR